jgi:hypothetical protein
MYDPLGNALPLEPRQLLDQVVVLDQDRSTGTGGLRVLVVGGERLLSLMASCEFRPLSETPLQLAFKKMKESSD